MSIHFVGNGETREVCNRLVPLLAQSFYNFGNNLRKFLEAYLFFRFPFADNAQQDHNNRIQRFFAGTPGDEPLVQRIANELSHLGEQFDRGMQPVDYAETSQLARFVLRKMKESDADQFACLLLSVYAIDPFVDEAIPLA